jgi:hypothetical protein
VNFYDILQDGFHTPLSATQIADLFHSGRLDRSTPCRRAEKKEWRTVDELFPLLKYQSATISCDGGWEPANPSPRTRALIFASLVAACAMTAVGYYFGYAANSASDHNHPQITETRWPRTISMSSTPAPATLPEPETKQPLQNAATTYVAPRSTEATRTQIAQQRQADQQQRQQVSLVQIQEERGKQEQKARGQDTIIPLDQYVMVNVGGIGVSVKIHDNDVTSLDVWINGTHCREVRKEKGITQSGTDETFIYGTGRARLYYVWELSGKLNHCRLRVRED